MEILGDTFRFFICLALMACEYEAKTLEVMLSIFNKMYHHL